MIYIHVTGVLCIFIFSSGNSNPPNYFLGEKNIVFGVASLWPLYFIFAACPSSVLKWERTGDFKTGGEPNPFYNTSSTLLHQTTSRYTLILGPICFCRFYNYFRLFHTTIHVSLHLWQALLHKYHFINHHIN